MRYDSTLCKSLGVKGLRKNRDGTSSITPCPSAVAEYSAITGEADRFDQRRERYAVGRHLLKWWHHLLYFHIDLGTVNSFTMWNCNNGGQRDQLSLRFALIRQLTVGRPRDKKVGQTRFSHKRTAGYLTTCGYEKLGNICQFELRESGGSNATQGSTKSAPLYRH